MAKKNGNGWVWKVAIFLTGALVAAGGYIATVRSNTQRIEKVEVKAHEAETAVIGIQKDVDWIKGDVAEIKVIQREILVEVRK